MSAVSFLLETFERRSEAEAIVWRDRRSTYGELREGIRKWQEFLAQKSIEPGTVVLLEGDFSPNSVALWIALVRQGCILVPLARAAREKREEIAAIALGEISVSIDGEDEVVLERFGERQSNLLYEELRSAQHPGLVLFSSGSTGKRKAAVHDFVRLLEKFKKRRHAYRTLAFLLFDHIGGLNTLFYTLANGGTIVTVQERSPDAVMSAIEKFEVELLPTSPTLINLILLSEAYKRYNLSSLRIVTYGTEPMPESTLKRFSSLFPRIQMLQTYGLSEVGILRSKSKSSDSLWMRIGGEEFETRVVGGMLQIKANSAMLGYLNAESPLTEDGWFMTGDSVEVDGEYVKILGRKSDLINVGGQKVYPTEVESVIQEMENVAEVSVYREQNAIMGSIVCARVTLKIEEDAQEFSSKLKRFCRERMEVFKVPLRVVVVPEPQHSERFKKIRDLP